MFGVYVFTLSFFLSLLFSRTPTWQFISTNPIFILKNDGLYQIFDFFDLFVPPSWRDSLNDPNALRCSSAKIMLIEVLCFVLFWRLELPCGMYYYSCYQHYQWFKTLGGILLFNSWFSASRQDGKHGPTSCNFQGVNQYSWCKRNTRNEMYRIGWEV